MKKRLFAIPSLLAAGFLPAKVDASPISSMVSKREHSVSIFERLRLQHVYTLAGHRSHSSHSSHSSHRSSGGGAYVTRTPRLYDASPILPVLPKRRVYQVQPETYRAAPNVTQDNLDTTYFPAVPQEQPAKILPGNSDKFRQIVIQVQNALSLYGYYDGVIDGKIGPQSKVALAKMQTDYGLKVTGTITPEVLNSLGIRAY